MRTYTKGPWRVCAVEGGWDGVCDSQDQVVCRLGINNPLNADIIAAAPELLNACRALLKWVGPCDVCAEDDCGGPFTGSCTCGCHKQEYDVRAMAEAAITKAEGTP